MTNFLLWSILAHFSAPVSQHAQPPELIIQAVAAYNMIISEGQSTEYTQGMLGEKN